MTFVLGVNGSEMAVLLPFCIRKIGCKLQKICLLFTAVELHEMSEPSLQIFIFKKIKSTLVPVLNLFESPAFLKKKTKGWSEIYKTYICYIF